MWRRMGQVRSASEIAEGVSLTARLREQAPIQSGLRPIASAARGAACGLPAVPLIIEATAPLPQPWRAEAWVQYRFDSRNRSKRAAGGDRTNRGMLTIDEIASGRPLRLTSVVWLQEVRINTVEADKVAANLFVPGILIRHGNFVLHEHFMNPVSNWRVANTTRSISTLIGRSRWQPSPMFFDIESSGIGISAGLRRSLFCVSPGAHTSSDATPDAISIPPARRLTIGPPGKSFSTSSLRTMRRAAVPWRVHRCGLAANDE